MVYSKGELSELWGQQRAGLWFLRGFSPDATMQESDVQANMTALQ